jgi:sigma-54 specific flagellar transcriptional regulator A
MEAELFNKCPSIIGQESSMENVRKLVGQVANTDATVLILGESGTGKEVVARNIHEMSDRKDGPFVPINCGAIPEELIESELFGHDKGAFTGAITARAGRFELAEGGTLFLDEIGDMPLHTQVKLLRVLQEHNYCRVGSCDMKRTNVRIIAATHQDLEQRVEDGDFRTDLYYRLNVIPIEISPLRERQGDLPLLIEELRSRQGLPEFSIEESAMRSLMQYDWPGNVRELGNLIERLAILFGGQSVSLRDLPPRYVVTEHDDANTSIEIGGFNPQRPLPEGGIDLRQQLQNIEVSMIREALDVSNWVVARSAKLLGLQRTTLVEKMRKYSIDRLPQAV